MGKVPLAQRHELARRSWASHSAALPVCPALRVPLAQAMGPTRARGRCTWPGRRARPGARERSAGPASGSHLLHELYGRPKTSMSLVANPSKQNVFSAGEGSVIGVETQGGSAAIQPRPYSSSHASASVSFLKRRMLSFFPPMRIMNVTIARTIVLCMTTAKRLKFPFIE